MTVRRSVVVLVLLAIFSISAVAQSKASSSLTIVYKDHHERTISASEVSRLDLRNNALILNGGGHEEKISLAEISRIEVHAAAPDTSMARSSFIGKWEVGLGGGAPGTFHITLDRDGSAHKSIGSHNGKWTFVDGEARIEWEDGWRDVIAKVDNKYEKRAYAPGKSYSDAPSSVSDAKRANNQSI